MKPLIVANWKMNPASFSEAKKLFNALKRRTQAELVICPPFVFLSLGKDFKLGAQDCFWQKTGPFTGEVSASQLKSVGVKYVIVGHSERERLGETSQTINRKLLAVLKEGLRPIFCLGETLEQKKKGETFTALRKEIKEGLAKVTRNNVSKIVFAYEPLWAIGSNTPCQPEEAETVSLFIRKIVAEIAGKRAIKNLKVLYGGSVNSQNAGKYLESEWLDGLLIGGASLKPKEFLKIACF